MTFDKYCIFHSSMVGNRHFIVSRYGLLHSFHVQFGQISITPLPEPLSAGGEIAVGRDEMLELASRHLPPPGRYNPT